MTEEKDVQKSTQQIYVMELTFIKFGLNLRDFVYPWWRCGARRNLSRINFLFSFLIEMS